MQAANAADVTGDAARQETLLRRTLELVDEESQPSLARRCWSGCRGRSGA